MKIAMLVLALTLPATVAWGQAGGRPANDSFHVSWQREASTVTPRIQGRVHNDSRFRVTDVRLQVEGLDAGGRPVGQTHAWAFGDILPGGETAFIADAIPGAVSYRIAVYSFDLVSEGP